MHRLVRFLLLLYLNSEYVPNKLNNPAGKCHEREEEGVTEMTVLSSCPNLQERIYVTFDISELIKPPPYDQAWNHAL